MNMGSVNTMAIGHCAMSHVHCRDITHTIKTFPSKPFQAILLDVIQFLHAVQNTYVCIPDIQSHFQNPFFCMIRFPT